MNNINNLKFCETFNNKKVLLTTRQLKNLKKMLVTAKFDLHPELLNRKPNDCSHERIAFTIKIAILNHASHLPLNGKSVTWNYNKFFDCDSKDV